ncbi:hypothetical protein AVEN_262522-1 [Araneus ventricosus]|uniref:Uncharacterized protein n=1 Tax=Araneus ventricosus TaxID=182803 RepID=A0A4Y2HXQ4_ARAVE|nr:hypothetical protein AVEN_262522-1 [Araneus ventricosus]
MRKTPNNRKPVLSSGYNSQMKPDMRKTPNNRKPVLSSGYNSQMKPDMKKPLNNRKPVIFAIPAIASVQVWLNALKAANAPVNDLMLWDSVNMHEKYNHGVARAALLTFSRHLWYLTGEVVTFSLFSKKVPD